MKTSFILALLAAAVLAVAQQPTPYPVLNDAAYWSLSDIKALQEKIAARERPNLERLGDAGSIKFFTERRSQGEYEPEAHTFIDDLYVVQDGEAILLYGGKIEGGRDNGKGEIRGGTIIGGTTRAMAAGDVVFLPAGTPHQINVPEGKHWYVLTVKANSTKTQNK